MRRAVRTIAALTGALVLLAGCSLLPRPVPVTSIHGFSDGRLPALRFGADDRPGLDAYYDQRLDWEHCAPATQCADFHAPLDWWQDRGGSVDLAVARHRATGTRLGSLVIDLGGPGVSGVEAVAGGLDGIVSAAVARHYDVIGIDPRGVGYSTAVRCGGRASLDALYYRPTPGLIGSAEWIRATRDRSAAFAHACRERSGSLLDHVDSVSAARDLELLRRLLGASRLDYLGDSYGTELGQYYAGMFPSDVGRMVLDGVSDPWFGGTGSGNGGDDLDGSQGSGFEQDFDAYLTACLAGTRDAVPAGGACPYSGTLAQAHAAVAADLARARTAPLAVPDGRLLTDAVLVIGIEEALYSITEWPRLSRALVDLHAGRPARAMALADEYYGRGAKGYYDNSNEAFLAITCLDYGSSYDLKSDHRELARLTAADPLLGPYSAYGDLGCAGWDEPPSPFPAPVTADGAAPILVVGQTGDPATPYPQARSVAKRLASGTLVTLVGDGHVAYESGSTCIDRTIDAYLLKATVPAKDPRCHR